MLASSFLVDNNWGLSWAFALALALALAWRDEDGGEPCQLASWPAGLLNGEILKQSCWQGMKASPTVSETQWLSSFPTQSA